MPNSGFFSQPPDDKQARTAIYGLDLILTGLDKKLELLLNKAGVSEDRPELIESRKLIRDGFKKVKNALGGKNNGN